MPPRLKNLHSLKPSVKASLYELDLTLQQLPLRGIDPLAAKLEDERRQSSVLEESEEDVEIVESYQKTPKELNLLAWLAESKDHKRVPSEIPPIMSFEKPDVLFDRTGVEEFLLTLKQH
jgi:hypothetical protein